MPLSNATKGDAMSNEERSPENLALQPAKEALALRLDALSRRLDDLERRNRRLKQILVAVLVGLAAVGTGAQVAPGPVTSHRVTLVHAHGRSRPPLAMLAPLQGTTRDPVLTFLDASGRQRVRLGLGAKGPLLEVVDENGKTRDYLGGVGPRPLTQ